MRRDYMTLVKFHEKYPHLHKSLQALKVECTNRHSNGFGKHEVILERRQSEQASRPSLLISPDGYFEWLEAQNDFQARVVTTPR
jgi:hypothetical protein